MRITDEQILKLDISSDEKIEWVNTCLMHKNEYDLPKKISIKKDNGIFYNTMPAILELHDVAGLKTVNRYINREPSLESIILLYQYSSGKLKAISDGNEITSMRTGAVAVHSAEIFAIKDFKVVSMVGLGDIMRHTADIFFDRFKSHEMLVKLYNYKNRAEDFQKRYESFKNVKFVYCDSVEETFKDSDLIFSAVSYIENDFCDESIYKKGCTIIPIHTRGFMGCDLTFDKIFGDDAGHVCGFKYFNEYKYFAEVAEVLKGEKKGRENDDERILVYNIGLAIHDLYYSDRIIDKLQNNKICQ